MFKDGKEYIVRAHKKKLESSLVHVGQLKRLVNASQNLTLLMVKQQDFVQFHFHIIADINDDMFKSDNSSSLKEDDKRLHKVPLVSIDAENEVSVQSSVRFHEKERHATKDGTQFDMGQCWFQNSNYILQKSYCFYNGQTSKKT